MSREMSLSFKDWRGNDITIGTKVIYPAEYLWSKSLVEATVVRISARIKNGMSTFTVGVKPICESAERKARRYPGVVTIHHWWNLMALPEEKSELASPSADSARQGYVNAVMSGASDPDLEVARQIYWQAKRYPHFS